MHRRIFAVLILVAITLPAVSLDLTATFNIGTMSFADTREASDTTLPLIWPWGLGISAHHEIDTQVALSVEIADDPTLKWVGQTLIEYRLPFFTLSVGPFFGIMNSTTSILKPGITTAVHADIPQIAFVDFRADSSIGGRLIQAGDYLQERSDIRVGFYTKNAIASLNLLTKTFIFRSDTQEIVDSYLEYSFGADLFQKKVPFRVLLEFAFQERGKSYIDVTSRTSVDHRLRSIVLGTTISVELARWLSAEINVDSSIFSFGNAGDVQLVLPTTGIEQYLFNGSVGIGISLD